MYHIKISNADFQTDVKLVSGMITPTEQPSYLTGLFTSFIIVLVGAFLFRGIRMRSRGFSLLGTLDFCIALFISLIIVYNIAGL